MAELTGALTHNATWRDYLELTKPRVVLLMILTAMVGMCLASPSAIPLHTFFWGNLGIALAAGSAATINHVIDKHIDGIMRRTERRPLVQGRVTAPRALLFAGLQALLSMLILTYKVNGLTALLSFLALIGYAGVYTLYLKRATPQNIVIGGIAGAAPPLLGWAAVTGTVAPHALLLVLIIFAWTPPHFWALAIHRVEDYKKAEIPMLTNTHGIRYTKLQILLYTWLLVAVSLLPFATRMSGVIYLAGTLALNGRFLWWAYRLYRSDNPSYPLKVFRYSIYYLMYLFLFLLVDHYLLALRF